MTVAVYPGTFDPLTNGHVDVLERCVKVFDELIVAVAKSAGKNPKFSLEDRLAICEEAFSDYDNIQVEAFDGLLVDFLKAKNASVVLRGLRGANDLDFEFQLSGMNKAMFPECETFFIKASETTASISSTMVREIMTMGGDVSMFVPGSVLKRL